MKRLLLASMVAVAALASAPVAAAPAKKSVAARDWTRTVVATPAGFRMGNPDARVKLIEYGSLTCSYCADFSRTGMAPLSAMVRTGKVSFEYRPFVLNAVDLAASLIARCGGPGRFFPVLGKMYASQEQWTGKVSGMSDAQAERLNALPLPGQLEGIADIGGLTQLAAASGIAPKQAKKCLADEASVQKLAEMHDSAAALGVEGTPSFFINGAMVDAHGWAELAPLIRKAGG